MNSISNLRSFYGSGIDNLQSYGSTAYQNRGQSYNNVLNVSSGYGGARRGRLSTGFGAVGLSSSLTSPYNRDSLNLSLQSYRNGNAAQALGSDLRSMPSINGPEQVMLPLMNDMDPIILLPGEANSRDAYERQWEISAQEAIKPFEDRSLLMPNLQRTAPLDVEAEAEANQDPLRRTSVTTESLGLTTSQGEVYTAQQISLARNYIRDKKFDQALNCYQAARSVNQKNTNTLVGIALCHIMTGKMQAGGLNVKFLAEQDPTFWQTSPDFMAIFGVSSAEIRQSIAQVEPEVDQYLSRYNVSDSKETAENLKLAHLSKMFLAWLKGDQAGMRTGIQAAADASPLDAPVQKLCRGIVGCQAAKSDLKLEPIEPLN
jgi:tetratricopeptide (TPR) repeat protein